MNNRKKKNKKSFKTFISFCILIIFIMCECLYFNIGFNSDFKQQIDNFPSNVKNKIYNSLHNLRFAKDNKVLVEDNEVKNKNESIIDEVSMVESIENNSDLVENEITIQSDNNIVSIETNDLLMEKYVDQSNYTPISEKKLKYTTADLDYFNNSLFIGDSRMSGFEIYKKLPGASYFCYSSASVFNIFDKEDTVDAYGSIKLFDLLSRHKFDKIYIMLGINNLQTNYYNHKVKYKEMLDTISMLQPSAIIYVIANFHITDIEDASKPYLNNKNIDDVNSFIKGFADNSQIFYLDSNPMYDDEDGNLKLELSTDNIHIHIIHYDKFLVYLLSNALVEDTSMTNVIIPKN